MIRHKIMTKEYQRFMGYTALRWPNDTHRDERLTERLDDYVFLPIDWRTGLVDYAGLHAVPQYAPPPPQILSIHPARYDKDNKLCFVGDSFARSLFFQYKEILRNGTLGRTGCDDFKNHTAGMNFDDDPVVYRELRFPSKFSKDDASHLVPCRTVVVVCGQWDPSSRSAAPRAPTDFKNDLLHVLHVLHDNGRQEQQDQTKEGARRDMTNKTFFVLSIDPIPLADRVLQCIDWRTAPLIDAYNTRIVDATVDHDGIVRKFADWDDTYLLDNRPLIEAIWDEADDWIHSCRSGTRVIAQRLMRLILP